MSDEGVERFVYEYLARKVERAGYLEEARSLREHVDVAEVAEEDRPPPLAPDLSVRRYEVRRRIGEIVVELDGQDGDLLSWLLPTLREPAGDDLDTEEALEIATRVASPPQGAVLVEWGYQDVAGEPVFVAFWAHEEDGLPVERDFLRVLVNGRTGQPFGVSRRWHVINTQVDER